MVGQSIFLILKLCAYVHTHNFSSIEKNEKYLYKYYGMFTILAHQVQDKNEIYLYKYYGMFTILAHLYEDV